uniref:Uncharacterized protein n=1 Tax=Octopus bimaculoides TaxID=37653 RepID=A0A0L8HW28_OCTBM
MIATTYPIIKTAQMPKLQHKSPTGFNKSIEYSFTKLHSDGLHSFALLIIFMIVLN